MERKILLIVLGLVFLQFGGLMHGAIPASERAALIAFYNSTNGDNWHDNSGWKTPPLHTDGFAMPGTEGSWYGVTLTSEHVSMLNFNGNQLSGVIPSSLESLANLEKLYLGGNELSGSIPSALGSLSNLGYLWLNINQLSGSIPSSLGNLSKLEELSLGSNQLSGSIPTTLGSLANLKQLSLGGNQLSGSVPSSLGNLAHLTNLYLNNNQLSGSIPSSLGNLVNLVRLFFQHNQLSGSIPFSLGSLANLTILYLNNNQLSGSIPTSLTQLNKIVYLDIDYNCLTATDSTLRAWLNTNDPGWETHQDQCGNTLPETNPPFGSFDTPLDSTTVAGSIAVTGWALDDSGVASVKIYHAEDYIGEASFVEGARPDVAIAYSEYPANTKAGWGYMLLSNFLPDGPITLTVIATDLVGKTTVLGTKTINIDNTHAVKPFGAIDTPTQGGSASGKSFLNWGWVLTPQPNSIPVSGSTISVWVDGVNQGHPTYNNYRSDIATLFPGYANSHGAVGYFYLDTTKYSDGVHTIQWTATDNAGNTDGIGSRYFTIQNTSSDSAQSVSPQSMKLTLPQIATLPQYSSEPIYFRIGVYSENDCSELLPNEKGNYLLPIKELEPVEIQLGQNYTHIQGYLSTGSQLSPLPIGSALDVKLGTFSWLPGPGFLGSYSLVFVCTDANGQVSKKTIEIKIEPKFSN